MDGPADWLGNTVYMYIYSIPWSSLEIDIDCWAREVKYASLDHFQMNENTCNYAVLAFYNVFLMPSKWNSAVFRASQ